MAETIYNKSIAVTCNSEEGLKWFGKGLLQDYGFNHEEAIRCFNMCLSLDSNCVMAHYFIADSCAPNYNNPYGFSPKKGFEHNQKAIEMVKTGQFLDWEVDLIRAQSFRFCSPDEPKPTEELNRSFANEMRKVHEKFSGDPDVCALFAESLMLLAPWALWTSPPDITASIPETLELVSVLEKSLKEHPNHPGLCHFYIHTMELSATPEKALPQANVLREQYYVGHLYHMAAHIDMWVGHYKEAVAVHKKAIEADEKYRRESGLENNRHKSYRMHDYHFSAWAAMFDGQFAVAIKHAEEAEKQLDIEAVSTVIDGMKVGALFFEAFATIPWHVLVRFGKWKEIIERPVRTETDLYPGVIATAHYARGVAFAALGMLAEADKEREEFKMALQNKSLEERRLHTNLMYDTEGSVGILNVAEAVLNGEIEYHKGNHQLAFQHLRQAVERDIKLNYDEPWGWMMPARHALGALLLEQGEFAEAETVYRADLKMYKNNLWALLGLSKALEGQSKLEEAAEVRKIFEASSSRADVKIQASCFCATKTCC